MLNWTDIANIPRKRTNRENLFCTDVLLTLNNMYPINKLKQAQSTLTVGEESPFPGGCEKGLGKESPETP
jgi:hypothetical protein